MKKILSNQHLIAVLLVIIIFSGCLKDRITHTYTLIIPVYKSLTAVRADMKTGPATVLTHVGKIYIRGNYIFLGEKEKGIHIIDNSNPASPRNISFLNIPGNEDMAVKGSVLYADSYNDLVAFDISDPMHVVAKKFLTNVFPERGSYYPGTNPDSIMVIVDYIAKDTTVDYHNPSPIYYYWTCPSCAYMTATQAPAALQNNNKNDNSGTGGSMARFTVINDYLYTVTVQNLNTFDISTPDDPTFQTNSPLNWIAETIYPFKNRLFIGSSSGVFMYDISSPAEPASKGEFSHVHACDPVIADDNYAYVTLSDGSKCEGYSNQLDIVDIKDLDQNVSSLIISYPLTHPLGLSKDGNTLFICDDKDGLKIFDASEVLHLKMIGNLKDDETFDVITTNGMALVVGKTGLYQYDYADLSNIHLISKIPANKN